MDGNALDYIWTITNGVDALGPIIVGVILLCIAQRDENLAPYRYLALLCFSVAIEILCADIQGQFFQGRTTIGIGIEVAGRLQLIIFAVLTILRLLRFFFRVR